MRTFKSFSAHLVRTKLVGVDIRAVHIEPTIIRSYVPFHRRMYHIIRRPFVNDRFAFKMLFLLRRRRHVLVDCLSDIAAGGVRLLTDDAHGVAVGERIRRTVHRPVAQRQSFDNFHFSSKVAPERPKGDNSKRGRHFQDWPLVSLRLSGRFKDQVSDHVGLRDKGKVARFHLDRLGARALRPASTPAPMSGSTIRRRRIPARPRR